MPSLGGALDANVLFPIALCDTLLRAAVEQLYRPFWTEEILDEVERNLVRIEAQSADTFLQYLFDLEPAVMARIVREQAADLTRPPQSIDQVLVRLVPDVPVFVDAIRNSGYLP